MEEAGGTSYVSKELVMDALTRISNSGLIHVEAKDISWMVHSLICDDPEKMESFLEEFYLPSFKGSVVVYLTQLVNEEKVVRRHRKSFFNPPSYKHYEYKPKIEGNASDA